LSKRQFKTESKRILDLMINSIYTHREIFLRELISNASDAIDKLCYISLTDDSVAAKREDFVITVSADKDARTITVSDNGVGMTEDELENNLGVIARSGSLQFKKDTEGDEDAADIIGQFGVGFYSAFMVAKKVTVVTRSYKEETGHRWVSSGADGYTVTDCEKDAPGTEIVMELKDDSDEEKYGEFLEEYRLRGLIKKYSDYIRWPIRMGEETVNSMVPLWQRPKNEVSDEDCAAFFKDTFFETKDPASVIRVNAEGTVSYKAMLFIPGEAPYGYYTKAYEPGLRLYANGVMIMEKCADLLPECFRFVRGVVDSPDLSLNISREMLQHDRQLRVIANNLEKKVRGELERMMKSEPDKYRVFFKNFGLQLKYGAVDDYGMRKDELSPLLMFRTENKDELISLDDYVAAMPEAQKFIYFACAETYAAAKALPQGEPVREKGYDILCMTDHIDEFLVNILGQYKEKPFKSISDEDLGLETEEEKEELKKAGEENGELLQFVTDSLGGKVVETRLSSKLIKHPVCLTAKGPVSIDMERNFIAAGAAESEHVKAERVLELNAGHPAFKALKDAYEKDKDEAANLSRLLYALSELMSGLMPDDPAEFTDLVCDLMK